MWKDILAVMLDALSLATWQTAQPQEDERRRGEPERRR
jgi:hypothetical protein